MLNVTLAASVGCFTGLVFTILARSGGMKRASLDAVLGAVGGLSMAWFITPISENAHDPDSLNVAALVGALMGAFILVAVVNAARGK